MHTFAEKRNAAQLTKSAKSTNLNRVLSGQSSDVRSKLYLQRKIGNQAVGRLLQSRIEDLEASSVRNASTGFAHDFSRIPVQASTDSNIQPKLKVNAPGDIYELEADRVADQVMRLSQHTVQSQVNPEENEVDGQDKAELIQRKSLPTSLAGGSDTSSRFRSLCGGGQPLARSTRSFMESRFGQDFSGVRVHTDARAAESARALHASAYTIGRDVVFGYGRYAPCTKEGQHLLAHELTHVVQQRAGSAMVQRKVNVDDFEVEEFDQQTLNNYLRAIFFGEIEDDNDSDDKARFIVRLWRRGKPIPLGKTLLGRPLRPDELDARTKVTLIREMQSGFTGDDDERAILALLLHSSDRDLVEIFKPGRGLDPKVLDSDFHGDEEDLLREFYDDKFVGGREAALEGSRKLKVHPDPRKPKQTPPRKPRSWRKWAQKRIPFERWERTAQQDALREHRAARGHVFTFEDRKLTTKQEFEERDYDKEVFRLLDPYYEDLKDFFDRSTQIRIEWSKHHVKLGTVEAKRGETVKFTAVVRHLDRQKHPQGEVEFFFPKRREVDIFFFKGTVWSLESIGKATLKNGNASLTFKIPDVQPGIYTFEARYPGKGNVIESQTSIRLKVV